MEHMPNIASVLKEEIRRLARKELRANTDTLRRAVSNYRSEIAALKRRVELLERQQKRSTKAPSAAPPQEDGQQDSVHRWRASGFAQHRKRLGLSAAEAGRLLGASALSVYKWESGQARPRAKYMPAIAELRSMGKREAAKRLAEAKA